MNKLGAAHLQDEDQAGLALAEAIWKLNESLLTEVLQCGVNPNISTPDGQTALALACKRGTTRIIEILLEAGADPNQSSDRQPQLLFLLKDGPWSSMIEDRWSSVRLLLQAGACVEATDGLGHSILEHAWENGNGEALTRLMLDLDQKPRIPDPAIRLISAVKRRQIRQVQSLLSLKIDPDGRCLTDTCGMTPLMLAAQNGDYDITQLLISYGANPRARTVRNKRARKDARASHLFVPESTALELAVRKGIYRVVQLLLVAGAVPCGKPSEFKLISIAESNAREDLVELLEEYGYTRSNRNSTQTKILMLRNSCG